MQNLTCIQTQHIGGGLLGVTPAEIQQLTIMTGLIVPRAIVSVGINLTGLNMNSFTGKLVSEGTSVAMTGISMIISNYFFAPDKPQSKLINNSTVNMG